MADSSLEEIEPFYSRLRAISFNELIKEFWAGRLIMAVCVGIAFVWAFFIIHTTVPGYTATMTLAPAESNVSSGGGGQGFLSALTGGGGGYSDYAQFLDMMHSVRLAKQMDERYGTMKMFFPYDETKKQFVPPDDFNSRMSRFVLTLFGQVAWEPPSLVDLARRLNAVLDIDREDAVVKISYTSRNRDVAKELLERVYAETDRLMRAEKLRTRTAMQTYVTKRLADTPALDQRTVLINLWGMEETQILLLASGDPVGARLVDDIAVPSTPESGGFRTLLVYLMTGFVIGTIIIIVRGAFRRV